jgi:hypothetical protein
LKIPICYWLYNFYVFDWSRASIVTGLIDLQSSRTLFSAPLFGRQCAVSCGWFESVYRQQNNSQVQCTLFRPACHKIFRSVLLKKI